MKFTIKAGQLFSECQHQLQQASLYYITTSKEYLTAAIFCPNIFILYFFGYIW